jgi:hypothetical protein
MDKLAKQLRADAERIDVAVSDELEQRILASLHGVSPRAEASPDTAAPLQQRPARFWWTSSLTGIAAAALVIVIINSQSRQPDSELRGEGATISPVTAMTTMPVIDWKAESAMLTSPLREELENLQSDIKKAEEKVKQDIGL